MIRLEPTSTVPVPVGVILTLLLPDAAAIVKLPEVAVILVAVAAPRTGVVNDGLFANTKAPVPVSSEHAVANSADVNVIVLVEKLIDLLVNVSVVARPTKVSAPFGRVTVPEAVD